MLDIVGDLSLAGFRLQGHVIAVKPGHPINVGLAQKLIAWHEASVKGV
jgi:UDP-3-O-[3-hydroxymyristoyl] N-acetylglucosamine deacetylase/3-hydroxyacyl-[acyl-carrier-protein] dehydratase